MAAGYVHPAASIELRKWGSNRGTADRGMNPESPRSIVRALRSPPRETRRTGLIRWAVLQ